MLLASTAALYLYLVRDMFLKVRTIDTCSTKFGTSVQLCFDTYARAVRVCRSAPSVTAAVPYFVTSKYIPSGIYFSKFTVRSRYLNLETSLHTGYSALYYIEKANKHQLFLGKFSHCSTFRPLPVLTTVLF